MLQAPTDSRSPFVTDGVLSNDETQSSTHSSRQMPKPATPATI